MYWLSLTAVAVMILTNYNFLEDKVSYSFLSPLVPNTDITDTTGCLPKPLCPSPLVSEHHLLLGTLSLSPALRDRREPLQSP